MKARVTIENNVKQKLLDSLAEEPTMVISTAYVYAKNYVEYGEDITKAWTTAVEQASILEKIKIKAKAEAYDSFKKEYENRLKADLVAMLTELQLEIEEMENPYTTIVSGCAQGGFERGARESQNLIQQKINSLKENKNESY